MSGGDAMSSIQTTIREETYGFITCLTHPTMVTVTCVLFRAITMETVDGACSCIHIDEKMNFKWKTIFTCIMTTRLLSTIDWGLLGLDKWLGIDTTSKLLLWSWLYYYRQISNHLTIYVVCESHVYTCTHPPTVITYYIHIENKWKCLWKLISPVPHLGPSKPWAHEQCPGDTHTPPFKQPLGKHTAAYIII